MGKIDGSRSQDNAGAIAPSVGETLAGSPCQQRGLVLHLSARRLVAAQAADAQWFGQGHSYPP